MFGCCVWCFSFCPCCITCPHKIRNLSDWLITFGRYSQIRADTRKYAQIRAGTRTYVQIRANTCKHVQIHTDTQIHGYTQMLHNRVTSAARERAQRAQRAKRRKDTANSHEQLQGAPFSSVRRHVPASLIIITRFPFTYQTGFPPSPAFYHTCPRGPMPYCVKG